MNLRTILDKYNDEELKGIYQLAMDVAEYNNEILLEIYNQEIKFLHDIELPILTPEQLGGICNVIEGIIIRRHLW